MSNYEINYDEDIYDVENTFYLRAPNSRFAKMLAHYELYRRIVDLPGSVVEFGVYKGASFMRLLAYRDLLENGSSRKIIGFDAFGRFPVAVGECDDDKSFIRKFESQGGDGIARDGLIEAVGKKGMTNFELVAGDVFETLPGYLEAHPELRVSLLHLDMDVYGPTRFVIDQLLGCVVPGGLVLFDDYGLVGGATRAADELAARLGAPIQKLPLYAAPSFIVVPGGER